ncbi:hypothetical protein NHX12_010688 [Muraenolepis orangiensis]|uniref:Uncharacterized protein n=1 Tax=Muraenolepis orangiensis TaxID=630683 RepID=A0A9Q0DNP4_9TELE|nr:hypothetical protein NHX12_010688 [Muraenolepis orangiensis]
MLRRRRAFSKGTCYEPFVKYGNFSSSDPGYGVGALVEFLHRLPGAGFCGHGVCGRPGPPVERHGARL